MSKVRLDLYDEHTHPLDVSIADLLALIRVARAAKAHMDATSRPISFDVWENTQRELHAALSDIEDSSNE